MTEPQHNAGPHTPHASHGLHWLTRRFLVRTAIMTFLTTVLIAMFSAVYYSPVWSVRYLLVALWSLGFFALTPLILKAFIFDRNLAAGGLLCLAKLAWIAAMVWIVGSWGAVPQGPGLGIAMIAGVTTPLLVAGLRLAGAASHNTSAGAQNVAAAGIKP